MTKPHPNSQRWSLTKKRPGHIEIKASAPKPDYAREMAVKAAWVQEWRAAIERGDSERLQELEGLMSTSLVSELKKG